MIRLYRSPSSFRGRQIALSRMSAGDAERDVRLGVRESLDPRRQADDAGRQDAHHHRPQHQSQSIAAPPQILRYTEFLVVAGG